MSIHSRAELIEYALRKLGAPVINIPVDATQVEDRVDEALQFFQDFHYDGTERVYLKHQIIGTKITVASTIGFAAGETVISTTGAQFVIDSIESATILVTKAVFKNGLDNAIFAPNEVITGQQSGAVTTVTLKVAGDIENRCVKISDMVTGVIRAVPWQMSNTGTNYFDPKYQAIMSTFQNLASSGMIYYSQLMSHLSLMDQLLRPIDSLRFNRKANTIYLDYDWMTAEIGSFILFEVFRILDPEVFFEIYNDRMLKKLVTAKIKYQFAINTQKYQGIQLLGGVTVDAATLMAQAVAELSAAEEEIRESYSELPVGFLG